MSLRNSFWLGKTSIFKTSEMKEANPMLVESMQKMARKGLLETVKEIYSYILNERESSSCRLGFPRLTEGVRHAFPVGMNES